MAVQPDLLGCNNGYRVLLKEGYHMGDDVAKAIVSAHRIEHSDGWKGNMSEDEFLVAANRFVRQGDTNAALKLLYERVLCERLSAITYLRIAQALIDLELFMVADSILLIGLQIYSKHGELLGCWAWNAHKKSDWVEALNRWQEYRLNFPDDPVSYAASGTVLCELGRFDEADATLRAGMERCQNNSEILGNFAWAAHNKGDWNEALRRWHSYRDKFPDHVVGYSAAGRALQALGRFDDADDIVLQGLELNPGDAELNGNYAWNAMRRQDWVEALIRWTKFRDMFPDQPLGYYNIVQVLSALGRIDEANAAAVRAAEMHPGGAGTARFMLKFESLGDNCEFGVVQRHFGADPLGLLRFTDTRIDMLTAALLGRFEGVGDVENTDLTVIHGEYMTTDKRFHMAMHTFIREAGDDHTNRLQGFCRRLRFLRTKLLRDLGDGEKIFVYGCRARVTDLEIRQLWEALQHFGPNKLLFVRPQDSEHLAETIRIIEDSLIVGYVDRLSVKEPSFATWFNLCHKAYTSWHPDRLAFDF